ncbi:hypothetical protein POM88_021107 [Heracleum sosnowskyi]|uniref:Uncharacterized protein n=1 Tax=Heracleum sosnowskyi TaxID=360622 RepID=A0AAD8MSH7_9APIA|nr:hypothetical protein POM88_021107 [Heracleum sosnowskyi]
MRYQILLAHSQSRSKGCIIIWRATVLAAVFRAKPNQKPNSTSFRFGYVEIVFYMERECRDEDIIDWCSDFLEEYKNVCVNKLKANARVKAKWITPTLGRLKINVDAAVGGSVEGTGIRVVVRNEYG